jgi:ectoine hydroxylase-related dioxygenase (phytanoyl-CoA dioxygenase family)
MAAFYSDGLRAALSNMSVTLLQTLDQIAFDRDGFAIIPDAVSAAAVDELLDALPPSFEGTGRGGFRNLFELPAVAELARESALREVASVILGPECFAVRALLFDKTPTANWKVTWHQDLTIAVAERHDVPGFHPWSVKAGVVHVQPPVEILERMVAVRLHLDRCGADNGPVRVLPGSHRSGKVSAGAIESLHGQIESVACVVPRGGLLVMRPLLLHASSPATVPAHRRVVHVEFATGELPGGLAWQWQL